MHIVYLISVVKILVVLCGAEKVQYFRTERPAITYYNPKFVSYANVTARRYSRADPFYYVDLYIHFLVPITNNISTHFYFYEFLTNRYRRGFVEMHFKICDLFEKDIFFGSAMRQGIFSKPCPHPPGPMDLKNMTIPVKCVPKNFPFKKGRIYLNLTSTLTQEVIGSGHIDMEIQDAHINKRKQEITCF